MRRSAIVGALENVTPHARRRVRSALTTLSFTGAFLGSSPCSVFVVDGLLFVPEFILPFLVGFRNPVFFLIIVLMEYEFILILHSMMAIKI